MKTLKLAPCPDCKRRISLTATQCPGCGRTIMEGDLQPIEIKQPPSIWWAVIVGILLFIILYAAAEKGREINNSRDQQIQKMEKTGREMYR